MSHQVIKSQHFFPLRRQASARPVARFNRGFAGCGTSWEFRCLATCRCHEQRAVVTWNGRHPDASSILFVDCFRLQDTELLMLAFAQSLKSLSSTPSKTLEIDTSELKSTTGKAHPKKTFLKISLYIWGLRDFNGISQVISGRQNIQHPSSIIQLLLLAPRAMLSSVSSLLGNGTANSNLYVAGLPPSTSEEMMRQLFKEFGDATWHLDKDLDIYIYLGKL